MFEVKELVRTMSCIHIRSHHTREIGHTFGMIMKILKETFAFNVTFEFLFWCSIAMSDDGDDTAQFLLVCSGATSSTIDIRTIRISE